MSKQESQNNNALLHWFHNRQLGLRKNIGDENNLCTKLYSSIWPCTSWDHHKLKSNKIHGGVYNLEFSPDGSLLIAACEKKSLLMFDPLNKKLITTVDNAHRDCVNGVRFLDNRTFASCSDDSTVALWDARNLSTKIRTLQGHKNWVKNIEYSAKDDLLVTSGFDGSVFAWDINCYSENSHPYQIVFNTNGLMRSQLSPNAEKMIISTTNGYLILIHDLNLKTLWKDLRGFKPNLYLLMQSTQQTIPEARAFNYIFSSERKVNRIELITDFPTGNEAEVISSLKVHPMGWCCLSRNVSKDDSSEWTCVHDIQEQTVKEFEEFQQEIKKRSKSSTEESPRPSASGSTLNINSVQRAPVFPQSSMSSNELTAIVHRIQDLWEALMPMREARMRLLSRNPEGNLNSNNMQRIFTTSSGILDPQNNQDASTDEEADQPSTSTQVPSTTTTHRKKLSKKKGLPKIYKNLKRLKYHIEEPNVGKGIIKELCFSPDGRIICSPFGYGMRLLAFSPQCEELSTCIPESPVKLYELGTNICHSDIVVSSQFSPKHLLLVTGCLSGRIVWHQPVF